MRKDKRKVEGRLRDKQQVARPASSKDSQSVRRIELTIDIPETVHFQLVQLANLHNFTQEEVIRRILTSAIPLLNWPASNDEHLVLRIPADGNLNDEKLDILMAENQEDDIAPSFHETRNGMKGTFSNYLFVIFFTSGIILAAIYILLGFK